MWPLSEDRFKALLDQLPAVFFADSHEPFAATLYLSANAATILGAGAEEHLADPTLWPRSIHPDDRPGLQRAWAKAYATEDSYVHDYRYRRPDGTIVWLREHVVPARDASGAVVHWQGMLLDVTREHTTIQELQDSETRIHSLLDHMPAFVYAISDEEDYHTLYSSHGAAAILGYEEDEDAWLRMGWLDIIHPEDRERVRETWHRSFTTGQPFDVRYREITKGGDVLWVHDRAVLIRVGERRSHWQGVVIDVTEEQRARVELEASEVRRHALIENLPAVVYEMSHDDERRPVYVSGRIEDLLGYSRQEWLEQPDIWSELLHPDDREIELAAHDLHSQTGEPWSREYRLIAADGRVVWVRDVARLVAGPDGVRWQGVFVDISAQKLAEEALHLVKEELELRVAHRTEALAEANELLELEVGERRRAEKETRGVLERFRRLVEDVPAVVYRWHVPDEFLTGDEYVSPGIASLLGYSAEEWSTEYLWKERLHPHDRDRVYAASARTEATGETFDEEYRYLARDGAVVWVHDRATLTDRYPDGRPARFQGVIVDISERKAAEQSAADAEARFREYLEQAPLISYSYRVTSLDPVEVTLDYVSPQMGSVLGYPMEELTERPERWFELIHPDDVDPTLRELRAAWAAGTSWDVRFRMLRADGRLVAMRSRGRCVERDEDGRPFRFVGAITDETEDAATRQAVETELARHRDVVEGTGLIMWSTKVESTEAAERFTFISTDSLTVLGYGAEDLLAERQHFRRLVHPDDVERVDRVGREADASPEGIWDVEYRAFHRDGRLRWLHGFGRRSTPLGVYPAIWHGFAFDVTHRHRGDAERREDAPARSAEA